MLEAPETPNRTVEEIKSFDGKTIAVEADVSKADQVQALIESTVKAFGGIDIVINNAGIEKMKRRRRS
jgi:NAD(P)-dependent dehydrogenase (short-subunit alcohol dehydrogenase family)